MSYAGKLLRDLSVEELMKAVQSLQAALDIQVQANANIRRDAVVAYQALLAAYVNAVKSGEPD